MGKDWSQVELKGSFRGRALNLPDMEVLLLQVGRERLLEVALALVVLQGDMELLLLLVDRRPLQDMKAQAIRA